MTRAGSHMDDAILPAVLPAIARRYWVGDPQQLETILLAGGTVETLNPDVEMKSLRDITGRGRSAIVTFGFDPSVRDRRSRRARGLARLARHAALRIRVRRARATLARMGYTDVRALLWDRGKALQVSGTGAERPATTRARMAHHLPQRAVVLAKRDGGEPTLLEVALAEAGDAIGATLVPERILPKSGMLVVLTPSHVLRLAVGGARDRITAQRRVLDALAASRLAPGALELLPVPVHGDVCGLVSWSVEPRLPGSPLLTRRVDALLPQAIDFLVELFAAETGQAPQVVDLASAADVIGRHVPAEAAAAVHRVASNVTRTLADVPRGFAHGDFFPGNLLIRDAELSGVIDWDGGGPSRLPLLDLLHLKLSTPHAPGSMQWGQHVVGLLHWAEHGGDAAARAYATRIGVPFSARVLPHFVAAYWLERAAYQLDTYADRRERPLWMQNNIYAVLREVRRLA